MNIYNIISVTVISVGLSTCNCGWTKAMRINNIEESKHN